MLAVLLTMLTTMFMFAALGAKALAHALINF
jgi:hypothetical protein